jgi:hypothetical protein
MRSHNYPTTIIRAVGVISLAAVSGDPIPIPNKISLRSCSGKRTTSETLADQAVLRRGRPWRTATATDRWQYLGSPDDHFGDGRDV